MNSELSAVQDYSNDAVITYFCHHHSEFSLQETQILFVDLLGWMWLNQHRAQYNKKSYLFGPLLELDKIWHVFILHTKDYVEFSRRYFGAYLHHDVEPIGFEHVLEEEELTDYLHDCFEYLGEEWVLPPISGKLSPLN